MDPRIHFSENSTPFASRIDIDVGKNKIQNIRTHSGLTAIFLKFLGKVVDYKDVNNNVYHLNKNSFMHFVEVETPHLANRVNEADFVKTVLDDFKDKTQKFKFHKINEEALSATRLDIENITFGNKNLKPEVRACLKNIQAYLLNRPDRENYQSYLMQMYSSDAGKEAIELIKLEKAKLNIVDRLANMDIKQAEKFVDLAEKHLDPEKDFSILYSIRSFRNFIKHGSDSTVDAKIIMNDRKGAQFVWDNIDQTAPKKTK